MDELILNALDDKLSLKGKGKLVEFLKRKYGIDFINDGNRQVGAVFCWCLAGNAVKSECTYFDGLDDGRKDGSEQKKNEKKKQCDQVPSKKTAGVPGRSELAKKLK